MSTGVHTQHGMTQEQFKAAVSSPENRGSIVFSRLDPDWSGTFSELGDTADGLQTAKPAKPFRLQPLPDKVKHTSSGANINISSLKQVDFHDWMKTFAQNIKDTLPENAVLPQGTQELLDSPSTEQMVAAARSRLKEVGQNEPFEGLKVKSMETMDFGGQEVYRYSFLNNGVEEEKLFAAEGLRPHIEKMRKDVPFVPANLGSRLDTELSTSVSSLSPIKKTMEKAQDLEVSGKISRNNLPMNIDQGVQLSVKRSKPTASMLGSAADASAAVAKGVSGSNTLRAAGAMLNILS